MNIWDAIVAKEIAAYVTNLASNQIPYLGEVLWPAKKRADLELSYFKGGSGLPVALKNAEFDTKAPLRDRIGFEKIVTEMPFFREAMSIKEKERQELLKLQNAANREILQPLYDIIYADANNLVQGARVVAEMMRMQLLGNAGIINVASNGLAYQYDYKFPAAHKVALAGNRKWSDTENSLPLTDIKDGQDVAETATGERPSRAVCTRKTWNYLLANKSIKLAANPTSGQNIVWNDKALKTYLMDELSLDVTVYNKMYSTAVKDGVSRQFFPDNVFVLLPAGDLGSTWYGTTPEEADLLNNALGSNAGTQVAIVNTGVAITTKVSYETFVNQMTVVSAIVLPSFEAIDKVYHMTVA